MKTHKKKDKDILKRIAIPNAAKVEIARITQNMNDYIAGVAAGLGIESKWSIDMQNMQFLIKDKL